MIKLLFSASLRASPILELDSQAIVYQNTNVEIRNTLVVSFREKSWKTSYRILQRSLQKQHALVLQGWELEYQHRWGPIALRLGNRRLRWGQLDVLSDLDTLNGTDQSLGPSIHPSILKIPTPIVTLSTRALHTNLSLSWLPFSAQDRLGIYGSHWSLVTPNQAESIAANAQDWSGDWLTEAWLHSLFEEIEESIPSAPIPSLYFQEAPDYGDFTLQAKWDSVAISGGIYAAWMRNRRPRIQLHPTLADYLQSERIPTSLELNDVNEALVDPISIDYPRSWRLGADVSTTISIFGLRGEFLYQSNRTLPLQYLQAQDGGYISAGIALDTLWDSNLFLLEAKYAHYLNPSSQSWLEASETVQIASLLRIGLPYQSHLQLQAGVDTAQRDGFAQVGLDFPIRSNYSILLQGALLFGPPQAEQPLVYSGGVIGYWQDEDYLSLHLQWKPNQSFL
ncbi:MAG: hypothetical protein VX278_08700 [Myxococcota bacterium]|nr:hypothetical protein [Myxococcota bacterium]